MRHLVLLSLVGCATAYEPAPRVSWSVDPACEAASDADMEALTDGAEFWEPLGVVVEPGLSDATTTVAYCFTPGPAIVLDGARYRGHTACDGPACTTRLNHLEVVPSTYPALIAHELAHALGVDGHLAIGEVGIMTADGLECDGPCAWTDADLTLFESFDVL